MYDYSIGLTQSRGGFKRASRGRWLVIVICLGGIVVGGFGLTTFLAKTETPGPGKTAAVAITLPGKNATPSNANLSQPTQTQRLPFEPRTIGATEQKNRVNDPQDRQVTKVIVAPGDNLSLIFGRHAFSKKDLHEILESDSAAKQLRRIKPGQTILVRANDEGHVLAMTLELDYRRSLHIELNDERYSTSIIEIEPEVRQSSVLATIKQSLFLDGQAAGLADKTIMELTDIFGWDIDFVLDVRTGDQFSVVYEEIFKDGAKVKNGKILAAEFVNRGKTLRAVYYSHQDGHAGYYSDKGEAMRKAFLRAPVNFTRISSKFNLRRRHPVLNTIRAHKGVDYAAPHGTPIRATAEGKVTFAGTKGGYGKTVVIQNGESYSTLFAHMSRYARGVKKGARVRQGQTIGYVGKTGLATGPHLHYEFRVNGVHRNPLKIALPQALPIDKKYIDDFRSKSAPLLAQLDEISDAKKAEKLVAGINPAPEKF